MATNQVVVTSLIEQSGRSGTRFWSGAATFSGVASAASLLLVLGTRFSARGASQTALVVLLGVFASAAGIGFAWPSARGRRSGGWLLLSANALLLCAGVYVLRHIM